MLRNRGFRLEGTGRGGLRFRSPMRRAACLVIAVLLAVPAGDLGSAPTNGTIQGTVHLEGRPLAGVTVAFIELQSGSVVRAISGDNGAFAASAPPGEYAVTTESQAGLTVGQAPVKVAVVEGKVASAEIELVSVPSAVPQEPKAQGAEPPAVTPASAAAAAVATAAAAQAPAAPAPQVPGGPVLAETTGTGAQIGFEPVTCFVAGEFPLLDATIEPMPSVARARVYFKGAQGTAYYYVEMTQETGRFFGKLPRPRVEASPITYYLQSTTTEFDESQTREIAAVVVKDKSECGDRKVAAFGPPGAITIFSASTGASILAPAGFAAAGAGLAVAAVALIAAGAATAGIVGGVVGPGGGGGGPTPPPIVVPTPIPVPTPAPRPTPTPVTTFR